MLEQFDRQCLRSAFLDFPLTSLPWVSCSLKRVPVSVGAVGRIAHIQGGGCQPENVNFFETIQI